jgi:BNR repeat-like domain
MLSISGRYVGLLLILPLVSTNSSRHAFAQSSIPSNARGASLVLAQRVDHVDAGAREPAIIEHPNGTLFVSGYGFNSDHTIQTVPRLWKSVDHGATWSRVNVGGESDGALADSDVSLAVAPDGTIYMASMQYDNKTLEGVHIVVGVSTDAGESWRWKMLSKKRYDDRPWVAVAPDGTAHMIWNDGSATYHSSTKDRGLTWSDEQIVHADAGSSHLAVGPKGEVAVRLVPTSASGNKYTAGIDLIAVSTDGGKSWEKHPAPGRRDWGPMGTEALTPRWIEPLAWDARGNLYSLWTDYKGIWIARSEDRGATWKPYKIAEPDALSYFPDLTVSSTGELAATWSSGAGEDLHWHASVVRFKHGVGQPQVVTSAPLQTEVWTKTKSLGDAYVRSTAGEYLQPLFLRDGTLAVVSPIQDSKGKRQGFTFWRFREP